MDIIPFNSSNLPAYLANVDINKLNDELTAHASGGFPIISIKGKVFAVVRDGERQVLTKEVDGEKIPAPSIDVVIVKANKGTSKVFYAKGYQEGGENMKPDCFSNDGIKPDAGVESPCSKLCATCKHNQWGSKIGEQGGKGKACSDSVRIAVATPDQINDPYLLRVPPASIRALGEYGSAVKKRGVAYHMLVTRVGFDMEAPTPKLTFKAVGLVDDKTFAQVNEARESDTVANILGQGQGGGFVAEPQSEVEAVVEKAQATSKVAVSKDKKVKDEEVAAAVAAAERTVEKKPAAELEVSMDDLNLDDLSFDD